MNVADDEHQLRVESHNKDTAYDIDEISEDNTHEFLVDSDEDHDNLITLTTIIQSTNLIDTYPKELARIVLGYQLKRPYKVQIKSMQKKQ